MRRTQIYLTEAEQVGLQRLADSRGATLSAMIREAVDRYLSENTASDWHEARLRAFGLWSGRAEPDLEALRREERYGDWND